jgi:hypothetical protein
MIFRYISSAKVGEGTTSMWTEEEGEMMVRYREVGMRSELEGRRGEDLRRLGQWGSRG